MPNGFQFKIQDTCIRQYISITSITTSKVSHDSSVGEWMYLTVCLTRDTGLFPSYRRVFKRFFPGWSHCANPSWASVAANLIVQFPLNGTSTQAVDIEEEGRCPTKDRQWVMFLLTFFVPLGCPAARSTLTYSFNILWLENLKMNKDWSTE